VESPSVATYPSAEGRGEIKVLLLMKKMCGVVTNVYSRKTLEKSKRQKSADFENEG